MSGSMNILTFDIEEWFHILETAETEDAEKWDKFETRIYGNTDRILNALEDSGSKATFFIVGWIAKRYPDIVKKISRKYEIGSHTGNHKPVWAQSPEDFRDDVRNEIKRLEDISGKKVVSFRAPGFSIRASEMWAFDTLAEEGIMYDASVFPGTHAHGGISGAPFSPFKIKSHSGTVKEFPVSAKKLFGENIIYSGGGYFRITPYSIMKKWMGESPYNLVYIHPRDMDPGQPVINSLSRLRKFKSYCGLEKAEAKLKQLLKDFKFIDISSADKLINWDSAEQRNAFSLGKRQCRDMR